MDNKNKQTMLWCGSQAEQRTALMRPQWDIEGVRDQSPVPRGATHFDELVFFSTFFNSSFFFFSFIVSSLSFLPTVLTVLHYKFEFFFFQKKLINFKSFEKIIFFTGQYLSIGNGRVWEKNVIKGQFYVFY